MNTIWGWRITVWRRSALAGAILISLSLSGCSSATSWPKLESAPPHALVLPVEGRVQEGNRCGPNALSILFAAAGRPVAEPAIAAAIQHERLDGALNIDLVLFARAQGFAAPFETGSIEKVGRYLEEGVPTLLMVKLTRRSRWFITKQRLWHYVVVYGVDRSSKSLLVHSGWGPRRVSFDELNAVWQEAGHWMMTLGTADESR